MKNKSMVWILVIIFCFSLCGCVKKKSNNANDEKLNIYVDIKDKQSLDVLKYVIDEYKKENPNIKVDINNVLGNDVIKDAGEGKLGDLIVTNRNNMILLHKKGILNDITAHYDKKILDKNYYKIIKSYGMYDNKYYGIGIMPYAVHVAYNKDLLKKMKISEPNNLKDLGNLIKKLNLEEQKIPVVLPDDIDMYETIGSLAIKNKVNSHNLINIYDEPKEFYEKKVDFQRVFDKLNKLYKEDILKKDYFTVGDETAIEKFNNNQYPIIICNSYYVDKFKDNDNIKLLEMDKGSNLPVIVNSLICVPVNSKHKRNMEGFIKFIYSDKFQKDLQKKGFITANMNVNKTDKDLQKTIVESLKMSDNKDVMFMYNIPEKLKTIIKNKMENVLNGKYNGHEWKDVLDEYFTNK